MIVNVEQAASLLNTGHVVAVPTETVYGLAASIKHPKAIEHIFTLKNRPADNPLIVHLSSSKDLPLYAQEIPPSALTLAEMFWPGPLTLVLKANTTVINDTIRAGLPTAAFRVPHHPEALHLLSLTGPLVMPSANLSGSPSATSSAHVAHDFGDTLPILEGGPCKEGVESTILIFFGSQWEIARLGAIAPEAFERVLGYIPNVHTLRTAKDKPLCPGQMYRHYAPKAKLTLATEILANATGTILGFSDKHYPQGCHVIPMGRSDQPEEVAERLYSALRQLDTSHIQSALVDFRMPNDGLWLTIRERLEKAASQEQR